MNDNPKRHLLPDEKLLWSGSPGTGIILRPIELFLIPFSLFWAGFAIFWNVNVWSIDAPDVALQFKLFGLPFLIAGIYITIGRFWLDIRMRQNLQYYVTDRRILICKKSDNASCKSLDIKRLPALDFDERPDGKGDIRFGSSVNWLNSGNFGIWQPALDQTPQFIRIDNARDVYELIQTYAS